MENRFYFESIKKYLQLFLQLQMVYLFFSQLWEGNHHFYFWAILFKNSDMSIYIDLVLFLVAEHLWCLLCSLSQQYGEQVRELQTEDRTNAISGELRQSIASIMLTI